jgi:hypothetical protein
MVKSFNSNAPLHLQSSDTPIDMFNFSSGGKNLTTESEAQVISPQNLAFDN